MNGIGELLHHTRTEQRCLTSCNVNCNTCFLIVKFLFIILFYVILGLVSIGIYIVLFVDVLIFVALVLIRLPGIGGEKNKCFHEWANCISFTLNIPIRLYEEFNEIFDVTICQ